MTGRIRRSTGERLEVQTESFGFRRKAQGFIQIVCAVRGVALVSEQLHLVAAGRTSVLQHPGEYLPGNASASVLVRDHDGLDEPLDSGPHRDLLVGWLLPGIGQEPSGSLGLVLGQHAQDGRKVEL